MDFRRWALDTLMIPGAAGHHRQPHLACPSHLPPTKQLACPQDNCPQPTCGCVLQAGPTAGHPPTALGSEETQGPASAPTAVGVASLDGSTVNGSTVGQMGKYMLLPTTLQPPAAI